MSRLATWITLGLIVFLVLPCLGLIFPAELLAVLSLGWLWFLARVVPQTHPDWSAVALGISALLSFSIGLHWFLSWFSSACSAQDCSGRTDVVACAESPKAWQIRWTASIVGLIVMAFVAGIAMVGLTHQVAWLATSDEPIIGSGFDSIRRMQSSNHLKQTALALHSYHDDHASLPPGASIDSTGQALHSWQTLLLPYAENRVLYEQIDQSQPWNAQSHRKSFSTDVPHYLSPHRSLLKRDSNGYALSHYAANKHLISGTTGRGLTEIHDGASNTLMCGEAGGNYKPWGNPTNWRDPTIGINTVPSGFGSPWRPHGAVFVFADGHTQFIPNKINSAVLRALATPAGNEAIGGYESGY